MLSSRFDSYFLQLPLRAFYRAFVSISLCSINIQTCLKNVYWKGCVRWDPCEHISSNIETWAKKFISVLISQAAVFPSRDLSLDLILWRILFSTSRTDFCLLVFNIKYLARHGLFNQLLGCYTSVWRFPSFAPDSQNCYPRSMLIQLFIKPLCL